MSGSHSSTHPPFGLLTVRLSAACPLSWPRPLGTSNEGHQADDRRPNPPPRTHRGFATRYDKLAVRYAATVHVASIDHWLRRLS